jgi:hypothetical protein
MLTCVRRDPLEVLVRPGDSVVVGLWAVWATRSVVQALWTGQARPQSGTVHSLFPIHLTFTDSPYNRRGRTVAAWVVVAGHDTGTLARDRGPQYLRYSDLGGIDRPFVHGFAVHQAVARIQT